MMEERVKRILNYVLVGLWALFTVSLICWWIMFGLRQLDRINSLEINSAAELARYHRMLMLEGGALLACVLIGGMALVYFVYRETRLSRQIQLFFLTFAHELKTPLASLRLQAESLKEDLKNSEHLLLVERLLADTNRLGVQLENSLFYTNLKNARFFLEELPLRSILDSIENEWPALRISLDRDCFVKADRRALQAVFKNLAHNSLVHGQATELACRIEQSGDEFLRLKLKDNGVGFQGEAVSLEAPFVRPTARSGNGLGLYLVSRLVEKMQGRFELLSSRGGFEAELSIHGRLA